MRGAFAVGDTLKQGAAEFVAALHDRGIEVAMITGDNRKTAAAIAEQVGIDRVMAEVLPADKVSEIERLRADGKLVAMVGDGINDGPALARANLGIAIGTGTDVAIESADITLTSEDLQGGVTALGLSRRTLRTIRQNLAWAFGYNSAAIPLAAFGRPAADRRRSHDGPLVRERRRQLAQALPLRPHTARHDRPTILARLGRRARRVRRSR